MQFNGTALVEKPTDLPVVVEGMPWFETEGRPFALRMAHPLSFDEMVAALYMEPGITAVDLATVEDVCGQIALTLTLKGQLAVEQATWDIDRDEARGRLDDPTWLAFCRERVTAVVTGAKVDQAVQDAA